MEYRSAESSNQSRAPALKSAIVHRNHYRRRAAPFAPRFMLLPAAAISIGGNCLAWSRGHVTLHTTGFPCMTKRRPVCSDSEAGDARLVPDEWRFRYRKPPCAVERSDDGKGSESACRDGMWTLGWLRPDAARQLFAAVKRAQTRRTARRMAAVMPCRVCQ